MHRSISCVALIVALAGCFERERVPRQAASPQAPGAGAASGAAAPKSPKAATRGAPSEKACAEMLARSLASGDMAAMAALIPAPEGPAIEAVEAAKAKVRAAVDAKFGAGAAKALGMGPPPRGDVDLRLLESPRAGARVEVVGSGAAWSAGSDTVQSATLLMTMPDGRKREWTERLTSIDGAWFLEPKDAAGAERRAEGLRAAATALETLAADVAAGKVASKDAAGDRYVDVVSKAGV